MKGLPSKKKRELLERLAELAVHLDWEEAARGSRHRDADNALLDYINDMDVRRAFERVKRIVS